MKKESTGESMEIIVISCIAAITVIIVTVMLVIAIFKIQKSTEKTVEEIKILQENQVKLYNKMQQIYEEIKSTAKVP